MNEAQFEQLVERYITGAISDADQKEFFRLLEEEPYRNLLNQILKKEWESNAYEEPANPEIAALVEQFVTRKINEPAAPARQIPYLKPYRVAAAAILAFLIAGTAWLLLYNNNKAGGDVAGVPVTIVQTDIGPGTTGAVLSLADGSTIALDSAGNGLVASQGATRIVRSGDGVLTYKAAGKPDAVLYNTLTTALGKQFHVKLPDGTDVWLNAGSSLRYPTVFTEGQRKVTVTGEAYFEVAKNAALPFIVSTGGQEITVLGTHFNVNAYTDEAAIRTTLLEGSVKVKAAGKTVVIKPGEQSAVTVTDIAVQQVNTGDAVAWKTGFFSFRGTDIKGIMRQLSRWYDVEVLYQGASPAETFTGKIDRNLTLAQVLKVLEQIGVDFKIEGKKVIIQP